MKPINHNYNYNLPSIDFLGFLIALLSLFIIAFFAFNNTTKTLTLPTVYWSVSQNKCKTILTIKNNKEVPCDCSKLSSFKKYRKVYIE